MTENAKRDENSITTLLAVSNADGVTPVRLYADPVTHRLLVSFSGAALTTLFQNDISVSTNGQTAITLTATALFIFGVYVNGQMLTLTEDYTFNGTTGITLVTAIPAGLNINVIYLHA